MEQLPIPDFKAFDATRRQAAEQQREGLFRRFGEFLEREASGDADHPAEAAREALEVGKTAQALDYLKAEIDKAEAAGDEMRRGDLMRWKTSLNSSSH